MKDMGLTIQFIDISKYIGKQVGFSTSFVKGYSSSLYKIINTNVKINLLAPKVKVRGAKKEIIPEEGLLSLLKGVKAKPNILVSGLIICLAAFAFGYYQRTQAQKEINKILSMRPKVLTADPASSYEELTRIDSEYKAKIDTLDKFIRQQMYFTEQLDAIPRAIPDNIWLTDLSSERRDQNIDFTLKGIAYVGDSSKELELINTFLSKLKENPAFVKYFKEIELSSVDNSQIGQIAVTNFTIQCRTSKRRQ
jgi:Tfp pilus assembly protein PilN